MGELSTRTEVCARCGGDVSWGATYAPDSSLNCAACTTTLRAAAAEEAREEARQTQLQTANKKRRVAVIAGVGVVAWVATMVLVVMAVGAFFTRLDSCVDRGLELFKPGGNFF